MEIALLPDKINAVEVFTGEKLDVILTQITKEAKNFIPDPTNEKGRKEIASMAYKVARSKTVLDDLGKDLVTDWKSKAKLVDEARKKSRDYLDALKDEVREPLTKWEIAEESRLAAEKLAAEIDKARDEADMENALIQKQKELAARESELLRKEEEAKAKAEAEAAEKARIEKEAADEKARVEREESIRKEAEAQAKADAAEALAKAERDKVAAEERAKLEAKQAEKNRIAAELKAKADQEAAVKAAQEAERARVEQERKEKDAAEAKAKAEADKLAANRAHQSAINKEALAGLVDNGFTTEQGKAIITLIAGGKVKHVSIKY
jgi:chromosome segregation ATPase